MIGIYIIYFTGLQKGGGQAGQIMMDHPKTKHGKAVFSGLDSLYQQLPVSLKLREISGGLKQDKQKQRNTVIIIAKRRME